MEGIKIVRKDGTVITADAKANKTASVFIGIFVVAFVLLSAYVYYLKTKLDRASINLSE
jgi:Tfp pilus assembly protein PilO